MSQSILPQHSAQHPVPQPMAPQHPASQPMAPQHTLFICQGCLSNRNSDDSFLDRVHQLNAAHPSGLKIQAAGCLWTCDRPCSAAFVCAGKYTYHFVDLGLDNVSDLLAFAALYQGSEDGYVKPPRLPESLQSKLLVRIPSTPV
jgi:predicted metal-binding protein